MEYLNIVVIALVVGLFFYLIFTQRRGQKGQDLLLLQQHVNDLREQAGKDMSQLSNMILRENAALGSRVDNATGTLTQVQGQLQQQMDSLRQQTSSNLNQLTEQLNQRLQGHQDVLGQHANIVKEVHGKLEGLFQATQGVMELKRDIVSLQETFKAPQYRGGVGEMLLEKLLKDALPQDLWELQRPFNDGNRVDAVIKMEGKLVPIDSKFPLDNFKKLITAKDDAERKGARRAFLSDVKRKIDDIAEKYIRPDEGTYDYAFMYIPAEGVYSEILALDSATEIGLLDYAWKKKVFPVSPNTFWAHLQAIHFGLKALQIEERAEEVIEGLQSLKIDFGKFRDDFETLGKHLRNSVQRHDDARKDLERFSNCLDRIESLGGESEAKAVETPQKELF
ncbi:MAG TPA: DNA recombination protein RmuC [Candidatus Hypogeohydataceae bacterium YC41]